MASVILVDDAQRAAPTGVLEQVRQPIHQIRKFTIRSARKCGFRLLHRPIYDKRPPDDVFTWHEAPITAVEAVVAIISENEILIGRNYQLTIADSMVHLYPPGGVHIGADVGIVGKIVAIRIVLARVVRGVSLVLQKLSVHV